MDTPAPAAPRHPKFVRWALLIGIVVILNIFFSVVVSLAFPQPQYDDFCPTTMPTPQDAASCDASGGVWTENPSVSADKTAPAAASGYCDLYAKCQQPFQNASEEQAFHAFALMLGLGIAALIIGLAPLGSSIVSSGLSYGGVVAFIIASGEYWGSAGAWVRLAIAVIALGALIYIGLKRFKD